MSYFPIIIIPVEIQRILRQMPPLPPFQEKIPKSPQTEPQLIENQKIFIELVGLMLVCAIALRINLILGTVIFIAGVVGIVLQIRMQTVSYSRRSQEHQYRLESYFKLLTDYSKKESQYQQAIALTRTPESLTYFRHSLLQKYLSNLPASEQIEQSLPEDNPFLYQEFHNLLYQYFPSKIYQNLIPKITGFQADYIPDFVCKDTELNLHIAIEIDEPYSKSKQITHYRDNWADYHQNELLIKQGWVIIRFSEEQVVRSPQSCCKTIAKVINEIIGDAKFILELADIPDLEPIKQWTEAEATQMLASNYRQTYLSRKS